MEHTPIAEQQRLMRMATRASLAVATSLVVVKVVAWRWTGSVAMLASVVDSALDALASTVALLAVHWSLEPADAEHRFGHGKLEPLAGLAQSALVLSSAILLLRSAVLRLLTPQPVQQGIVGLAVMGIATAATLWLVRYQNHVIRQTKSTAVSADALHYGTDLLMNAAVAVALLGAWGLGWDWLDPVLGLVVAVLVGRSAVQIGWEATQLLMDRELPAEDRDKIAAVVRTHPEVRGIHDLRTRRSGLHHFLQFHLELDGDMLLRDCHRIGTEVEREVAALYPGAEVLVHFDPAGDHDEPQV